MSDFKEPGDLPPRSRRPRRQRRDGREPVPWLWLGMGVVVTLIGIGAAVWLINSLLSRPPLEAANPPDPTIIVLTAPPSPMPTVTPPRLTPSPVPTFTPIPTPDTAVAPPEITAGFYAEVANTDGVGVTVRGGPSTNNTALLIAEEGAYVLVLEGPSEGSGFQWWKVQLEDGTEGWVAADFIEPSAAP